MQSLGGLENVDDVVAEALATALEVNEALKLLSLGQNRLTEKGASHLARALKVNHSLESLK
jgi:hypothetical protein